MRIGSLFFESNRDFTRSRNVLQNISPVFFVVAERSVAEHNAFRLVSVFGRNGDVKRRAFRYRRATQSHASLFFVGTHGKRILDDGQCAKRSRHLQILSPSGCIRVIGHLADHARSVYRKPRKFVAAVGRCRKRYRTLIGRHRVRQRSVLALRKLAARKRAERRSRIFARRNRQSCAEPLAERHGVRRTEMPLVSRRVISLAVHDNQIVGFERIYVRLRHRDFALRGDKRRNVRIVITPHRRRNLADNERHIVHCVVTRDRMQIATQIVDQRGQKLFVRIGVSQIGFALHPRHSLNMHGIAVLRQPIVNDFEVFDEIVILHAHRRPIGIHRRLPLRPRIPVAVIRTLAARHVAKCRTTRRRFEDERGAI